MKARQRRMEAMPRHERIMNPHVQFVHVPSPRDRAALFAKGFAWGLAISMSAWLVYLF